MGTQFNLVRETIAKLIAGSIGEYELDDKMGYHLDEANADALKEITWQVRDLFPPSDKRQFTSDKGLAFLKLLLAATAPSVGSN